MTPAGRPARSARRAAGLAALGALGALAGCAARVEHREVRDAIAAQWREHVAAAVEKDLDRALRIYDEGIVYHAGGEEVRGLAAIEASEARALESADVIEAAHATDALRVFGDRAYELGTVRGPVRPAGGSPELVVFHYAAVWKRGADGVWRIAHLVGSPE